MMLPAKKESLVLVSVVEQ